MKSFILVPTPPPPTNTARKANSVHLSLSFSFCLAGNIIVFSSKQRKWEHLLFCLLVFMLKFDLSLVIFMMLAILKMDICNMYVSLALEK